MFAIFTKSSFQQQGDFDGVLTSDVLNSWGISKSNPVIDIRGKGIRSIETNTFDEYKNCQTLNMDLNMIQEIRLNTFSGLEKLTALSIKNNSVKLIEDNSFSTHSLFLVFSLFLSFK